MEEEKGRHTRSRSDVKERVAQLQSKIEIDAVSPSHEKRVISPIQGRDRRTSASLSTKEVVGLNETLVKESIDMIMKGDLNYL
jgi:hypothetical protein